MLDWLKIGGGFVIGALAAGTIGYLAGHWQGNRAGYDRRIAEVAAAEARAELERRGDDAKLQGMSDYDLCVAGLAGSGMPVDACDELRGLPGQ